MRRGVGRQPAARLLELALTADLVAAAGLVPRDRDVDEALQEVALVRLRCSPRVFELFVRGEELTGADQLQSAFEGVKALACDPDLEDVSALSGRPSNPGLRSVCRGIGL